MTSFTELLQQGTSNAWLFIPSAILLGALHGLEPGHSKTMMAAFIVAIRGTVGQAVLLGLSATISHTAIVWIIALAGLHFGGQWNAEATEPYFQLGSAVIIISVALWMLRRTWKDQQLEKAHDHTHHHHGDEVHRIDTGHGILQLEVFEDGVPPRFRIRHEDKSAYASARQQSGITLETVRPDGSRQSFTFVDRGDFLESANEIPEPHQFNARLTVTHDGHSHDYEVEFAEHDHHHGTADHGGLNVADADYQDAHERAHANDIKRRFANSHVTNGQIVMFGLTGGLIPCPASITVLLLCLQLKQFSLGMTLVLCFSVGLALTMVASGTVAALSVKHASRRWSGFGTLARRAPYLSSMLIIGVGVYTGVIGWMGLAHI